MSRLAWTWSGKTNFLWTKLPPPPRPAPTSAKIIIGILAYSACSASLLLLNKVAVTFLPSVTFVLVCQFVSAVFVVQVCSFFRLLDVDPLSVDKVKKFWGVSFLFACCLFTNVKVQFRRILSFEKESLLLIILSPSSIIRRCSMQTWRRWLCFALAPQSQCRLRILFSWTWNCQICEASFPYFPFSLG